LPQQKKVLESSIASRDQVYSKPKQVARLRLESWITNLKKP